MALFETLILLARIFWSWLIIMTVLISGFHYPLTQDFKTFILTTQMILNECINFSGFATSTTRRACRPPPPLTLLFNQSTLNWLSSLNKVSVNCNESRQFILDLKFYCWWTSLFLLAGFSMDFYRILRAVFVQNVQSGNHSWGTVTLKDRLF